MAIWTSIALSFHDRFKLPELDDGTPVPKHFKVYLMLLGVGISSFGRILTALRLDKDKVFHAREIVNVELAF